jgi:hypothetical protein
MLHTCIRLRRCTAKAILAVCRTYYSARAVHTCKVELVVAALILPRLLDSFPDLPQLGAHGKIAASNICFSPQAAHSLFGVVIRSSSIKDAAL